MKIIRLSYTWILLLLVFSCNSKSKIQEEEIRDLYLETFKRAYILKDASTLSTFNLLDGIRKFVITLIDEKDSIGNMQYQVESYKTKQSEWKRIANLMPTQLKSKDNLLLSTNEMCDNITSSIHVYMYKYMP